MPRSMVLGNGQSLVCFDEDYKLMDFYYPQVGLENHIGRHGHKIGVWAENNISWLNKNDWELDIRYKKGTLVSDVTALNRNLQIELKINDIVYNETNILVRKMIVKNLREDARDIRVFFTQEFPIYEVAHGNTAYYDPRNKVVIQYKGMRVFLVNGMTGKKGFDGYTCGTAHAEGKEGSYRDAEDGVLSKNNVVHGSVDSVIGFYNKIKGKKECEIYYWIAAGKDIKEVQELNEYVKKKTPAHLIQTTRDFWHAWVEKQDYTFFDLSPKHVELFKRSLFLARILTDNGGTSIASPDSDILQFGRDTYAYMWPRDAAFVTLSLDKAGYNQINRKLFELCSHLITEEGFLMHKYLPDGSLGSSWHPWLVDGKFQYPIQEDETALIIFALEQHYEKTHSVEFIEELYNPLIKKAADFMVDYRDPKTKLPFPSHDLWEERIGVHTFTCATVYVALLSAANLSKMLGKTSRYKKYRKAAEEVKNAINKHLYDKEKGYYIRRLYQDEKGRWKRDLTVDVSSFYAVFRFQVVPVNSPRLESMFDHVMKKLSPKTEFKGIARYQKDFYMAVTEDWKTSPGNPWIICTLWIADYHIAKAKNIKDLKQAKDIIDYVSDLAIPSGILSEQINPYNGSHVSVSPLTWSHAQYVITILFYLKKMASFEKEPVSKTFELTNVG